MLHPADIAFALIVFGLSAIVSEVLLVVFRWRATLRTRAMLSAPIWAFIMGMFLFYRLAIAWGIV